MTKPSDHPEPSPKAIITLFFLLLSIPILGQEKGEAFKGTWSGHLETGQGSLLLRFHFQREEGELTGTMDSPDQGAEGIGMDSVWTKDDSLFLRIERIMGSYKGELVEKDSLIGQWTQSGMSHSLEMIRGEEASKAPPQQTPEAPYPYRSVDTTFVQKAEGFRLAGTVTLPEGEGPFPGLILVSGSGPQDRDENIMGHRPFHVIADHLTRRGFAVLRYDDRGTAASEGDFSKGTIDRFSDDARSALDFLKSWEEVEADRVGMLGHSEGGIVISQLATEMELPFLILMASPALPGDSTLFIQNRAILSASGMSDEMVDGQIELLDSLFHYMREDRDSAFIMERSEEMVRKLFADTYSEGVLDQVVQRYQGYASSIWFRSFIEKDPSEDLRELEIPILALFGENDLQVLPDPNKEAMEAALEGNDKARIEVIEGVNHLFQPDESGLPSNYGRIETTIHPPVLEMISEWLERR